MNRLARYIGIAAVGLVLAACGKKEEAPKPAPAPPAPKAQTAPPPAAPAGIAVSSINVGKAIGQDKKITTASTEVAEGDTMYASIDTTGAGSAKLEAKWTYSRDGKTAPVQEQSLKLETMGPATNEFHIAKPDGWPAGEYTVEISLDGKPVGSKKMTVK